MQGFASVGYVVALIALFNFLCAVVSIYLFRRNDPFHFANMSTTMLTLYRFETLQKTCKMRKQPLIRPFPVDMSATDAQIVRDNLDIFEQNGFRFAPEVDSNEEEEVEGEQACPSSQVTKRLSLIEIPHNFKTEFGAEDVRELATLVRENPPPPRDLRDRLGYVPPRHPRVRAMFASRACRSAIMIGRALKHREMVTELRNMVGLDQPWNCPHGRPTMRHLVDLEALPTFGHTRDPDEFDYLSFK